MQLHPQAEEAMRRAGELPSGLAPDELRRQYTERRRPLAAQPLPIALYEAFDVPGRDRAIPVRFYRGPVDARSRALLVYLHGGGWMLGSLDGYDATCRRIAAKADCGVLSVDYRLAPESPFPAALHDALDVTRWCFANATRLGSTPSMIAIGGDSAGGNLAAVIAQQCRDAREAAPALQVLIYPVVDASREHPSYARNAAGYLLTAAAMRNFIAAYAPREEDRRDSRVSPMLATTLAGLPRALVIAAEFDPLVDENEAYARRLAADGVPTRYVCFAGMIHPFLTLGAVIDASAEAEDLIAEELRALR